MQPLDSPPPIPVSHSSNDHSEGPASTPPPVPLSPPPLLPASNHKEKVISASHIDWKTLGMPRLIKWKMLPVFLLVLFICLPMLSILNILFNGFIYDPFEIFFIFSHPSGWYEATFLTLILVPLFMVGQWSDRRLASAMVLVMSFFMIGFTHNHLIYGSLYLLHHLIPEDVSFNYIFHDPVFLDDYSNTIMEWKGYHSMYYYPFWIIQSCMFAMPVILDRWIPHRMLGLITGSFLALALAIMEQPLWYFFVLDSALTLDDIPYYVSYTLGWWLMIILPVWVYALLWRFIVTRYPGPIDTLSGPVFNQVSGLRREDHYSGH